MKFLFEITVFKCYQFIGYKLCTYCINDLVLKYGDPLKSTNWSRPVYLKQQGILYLICHFNYLVLKMGYQILRNC